MVADWSSAAPVPPAPPSAAPTLRECRRWRPRGNTTWCFSAATGFTGGLTADTWRRTRRPSCAGRWSGATAPSSRRSRARLAAALAAGAGAGRARRRRRRPRRRCAEVAESTRVVITTVGPYALYGEPLVAACAAAGTDYVDLTGEPEFVDRMWIEHHAEARADRRPDRPLLRLRLDPARPRRLLHRPAAARGRAADGQRLRPHQRQLLRRHLPLGDQRLRPRPADARRRQGAPPRRAAADRARDPLGPAAASAATPSSAAGRCRCRRSTAPIVRRSAAALERYGPDFTYGHNMVAKHLATVGGARRRGRRPSALLAPLPPTRKLLLKMKSPGEGPSEAEREQQLVQGHLRRRGRRQARRHRGQRRRPRLRRDLEDARRVRPLPRLRRAARARRPGDHRGGDGRRPPRAAAEGRDPIPRVEQSG